MGAITNMLAAGHVLACKMAKRTGIGCGQLAFTHLPGNAAATTVNLWMVQLSKDQSYGTYSIGLNASKVADGFQFAKQTGFSCAVGSVMEGDGIVMDGLAYRITKINIDPISALCTVDCVCTIARTM